jgi:hypothetical protein
VLVDFAVTAGYIPSEQHAFRKEHSASEMALGIIHQIVTARNQRCEYHLKEEDISAAFDRVIRSVVVERVREMGADDGCVALISSFLSDRRFYARCNGASSEIHKSEFGTAQGSALGPILWAIHFSPIIDRMSCSGKFIFADDVKHGDANPTAVDQSSSSAREWCEKAGISMDRDKDVKTVFFGQESTTTRIVGVLADTKLKMTDHVDHRVEKAKAVTRRLLRLRPFFTVAHLVQLFKSYVWPLLEYGSLCLQTMCSTSEAKLESVQKFFLRCLGLDPTAFRIDSQKLRRQVGTLSLIYRTVVCKKGSIHLNTIYCLAQPATPAHYRTRHRQALHPYQLSWQRSNSDLCIYTKFHRMHALWNQLPADLFPPTPNLQMFKQSVARWLRSQA